MSTRGVLAGILLLGSVLLSWWLFDQARTKNVVIQKPDHRQIDYYFEDFNLAAMDENGKPEHRIKAPYLAYYPDTLSSELKQPSITIYDENGPVWTAESERGSIAVGGKSVELLGEVILTQSNTANADPYTIRTRDLHIDTENEQMNSHEPVSITNRRLSMQSVGMHADLAQGKLYLESQVRAKHILD